MEDEEERILIVAPVRVLCEVLLDRVEENRDQRLPIRVVSAQRLNRQSFVEGQIVEDARDLHEVTRPNQIDAPNHRTLVKIPRLREPGSPMIDYPCTPWLRPQRDLALQ